MYSFNKQLLSLASSQALGVYESSHNENGSCHHGLYQETPERQVGATTRKMHICQGETKYAAVTNNSSHPVA